MELLYAICPDNSSQNIFEDDNECHVEVESISSDFDQFSLQGNTPLLINQAELNELKTC